MACLTQNMCFYYRGRPWNNMMMLRIYDKNFLRKSRPRSNQINFTSDIISRRDSHRSEVRRKPYDENSDFCFHVTRYEWSRVNFYLTVIEKDSVEVSCCHLLECLVTHLRNRFFLLKAACEQSLRKVNYIKSDRLDRLDRVKFIQILSVSR